VIEPVYRRAPDVVWRLGPDRVLVRRVRAAGNGAASELFGSAALLWVALDEPASTRDVRDRMELVTTGDDWDAVIDVLIREGWVLSSSGELPPTSP
jgi:hypothetical protein